MYVIKPFWPLWVIALGIELLKRGFGKSLFKRQLQRKGQRDSISKETQREVWRRDENRCVECGSQEKLEYDHIIPVSKGGSSTARNIQLLCEKCNRKKYNKI